MPNRDDYVPVCLAAGGSDSGGEAGLQADLLAFRHFGVHGCCALSATTAQNPQAVHSVNPVSSRVFAAQIAAVTDHFTLGAVKAGMLASAAHIAALVRGIPAGVPLVVDPVLISTSIVPAGRFDHAEPAGNGVSPRPLPLHPRRAGPGRRRTRVSIRLCRTSQGRTCRGRFIDRYSLCRRTDLAVASAAIEGSAGDARHRMSSRRRRRRHPLSSDQRGLARRLPMVQSLCPPLYQLARSKPVWLAHRHP
jgi:hypothetical protein